MFKINENVVKNNSIKKTAKFIGISALAFLTTAAPLASTALNAATSTTPVVTDITKETIDAFSKEEVKSSEDFVNFLVSKVPTNNAGRANVLKLVADIKAGTVKGSVLDVAKAVYKAILGFDLNDASLAKNLNGLVAEFTKAPVQVPPVPQPKPDTAAIEASQKLTGKTVEELDALKLAESQKQTGTTQSVVQQPVTHEVKLQTSQTQELLKNLLATTENISDTAKNVQKAESDLKVAQDSKDEKAIADAQAKLDAAKRDAQDAADIVKSEQGAADQAKADLGRGTLTSNVEIGSALAALNAAKAAVQTAKNTAQPAEKIAALQAKVDLADANFQLASARVNGVSKDALKTLTSLVKTAQQNVVATEGKLAISLENKGRDLQAANQVKAETAAKTEAAKDLTPANLLKNLQAVTENAATTGKAANAANAALKAAQDDKVPAAEIAKLQAQADAANAAYKLADAQAKNDPFAVEAAQKAVDTANTKLLAVTQRQLAAKLVELGAKLADPKTTAAEKATLTSEANFVQGQFNKAAAALAKPSTAAQALAEIANADAARPAQVKLEADNAAKAAAAKLAAEKAAYAAAHPHFKAYLNGKVVVEGDFGKSSYGLNSRVARGAHVNTGSVKVVKTRSGFALQGIKAARGYKITSLSFWKGRNGSFGFTVKTAKVITLTVKAHFSKHTKTVGRGEFAVGAKTRTSARGYHFHGTAQVATKRVHGRTVTYIRGLSADRYYKITKVTISNYKGNKIVNVYTRHR